MNILEKKKNLLLGREEMIFEVEQQKTPSFLEVESMLHDKLKVDKEVIVVKEIKGLFGNKKFRVRAFLYNSSQEKEKIEPKKKEKKKPGEVKEEPKTEAKKEEAKLEVKK